MSLSRRSPQPADWVVTVSADAVAGWVLLTQPCPDLTAVLAFVGAISQGWPGLRIAARRPAPTVTVTVVSAPTVRLSAHHGAQSGAGRWAA